MLLSHKKNEITPCTATCTNLETIKLSKVSQKEEDKYYMIELTCRI